MGVLRLKRALFTVFAAALALVWTGCGGGGSSNNQQTKSNLPNRAFVTNRFSGALQIIDAKTDKTTAFQVSVGSAPTTVLLAKDKSLILVYASGSNTLLAVDPATEAIKASGTLSGASDSFVLSENVKFVYAAVKNAVITGQPNGAVQRFSLTDSSVTLTSVSIPNVRWVSLSHSGTTMLAFSDQSDTVVKFDPTATTPAPTPVV